MTLTNTLIDFDNLVLKSKDVFDDFEYYVCEFDGHYTQDMQCMTFDCNGVEVIIDFTLTVTGWHWYRPASYMEPDEGEVHITGVDVDIDNLYIGDDEVELTKELKITLESLVKKYIDNE